MVVAVAVEATSCRRRIHLLFSLSVNIHKYVVFYIYITPIYGNDNHIIVLQNSMEGGLMERYEDLGLRESLSRPCHYPMACKELSFILRSPAFPKFPKSLQSLTFQDVLTAFSLLPQMQTKAAASSANALVQSAEAALPKQKRVLALTEFKHAMVAHKRKGKGQNEEEGLVQLPQDVLVHIFGYLDLQSLLSAASVCQSWNAAASDNCLWHSQHARFFGVDNCSKVKGIISLALVSTETYTQDNGLSSFSIDWRDAFKEAYKGISLKKRMSVRGYCRHCNAIVWLSNMKCFKEHSGKNSKKHQIKPLSFQQIVEYILDDSLWLISSSDSDSDSDDGIVSKLWACPKHISDTSP